MQKPSLCSTLYATLLLLLIPTLSWSFYPSLHLIKNIWTTTIQKLRNCFKILWQKKSINGAICKRHCKFHHVAWWSINSSTLTINHEEQSSHPKFQRKRTLKISSLVFVLLWKMLNPQNKQIIHSYCENFAW